MPRTSVTTRLGLGLGKLRRLYLHMFNRDYLRRNLARRKGECRRCGVCCTLMFKCPFLEGSAELASCVRHDDRWENCRIFPIDERDLAERDRISDDGACGFRFDPPMKPQRWLFALAVAALGGLAAGSRTASAVALEGPLVLKSSFGRGRMPSGWRIESGKWEAHKDGLRCEQDGRVAALLRKDMLPVAGADFRVDIWMDLAGLPPPDEPVSDETESMKPPSLEVTLGGLSAGLSHTFGPFVGFGDRDGLDALHGPREPIPAGRARIVIETDGGLVSLSIGGRRVIAWRDLYRRSDRKPPRDVYVTVRRGVTVYAVRVLALPVLPRPGALVQGDLAMSKEHPLRAAAFYEQALADEALPAVQRAEAACKLGLCLKRPREIGGDAARAFDRAQRLDPGGPWGENARGMLAWGALDAGDPDTALRLVLAAAKGAAGRTENPYVVLVSRAREMMVASGQGPRATFRLTRLAEYLKWASKDRAKAAWAWEEVARSYEGRGWPGEAEEVRKRTRGLYGRIAEVATRSPGPDQRPSPGADATE